MEYDDTMTPEAPIEDRRGRDWARILAPVIIASAISSGISAGAMALRGAAETAAMQSALAEHTRRIDKLEAERKEYVTQTDQSIRDGEAKEQRDQINQNLRDLNAKFDDYIAHTRGYRKEGVWPTNAYTSPMQSLHASVDVTRTDAPTN